ncbi:MAG TPA: ATP-binding protein, partial [Candidatus Bathyarchaeia archaeon]|nr:ATP-binding protein [Candidatus Bathyarchaeia archaeon]
FTFDNSHTLKLVNRAGERLLGRPVERLLGFTAEELGLAGCITGEGARTVELSFPGGAGRWGLRRGSFRQEGLPHDLIVLSDLSRALREEERQAWQRLIRVLGHELNNSLAPIQSVAQSLESNLQRVQNADSPLAGRDSVVDDLRQGLAIIRSRTEALSRFMAAYARLARLPQPRLAPVDLGELVRRVAGLETRVRVQVMAGPPVKISADRDQLEQLLINLIRNAAEAVLETGGGVLVKWLLERSRVQLSIIDDGPGLSNTANLFVPFFTTKPAGSGIGLVLCRQIAEAHGGSLTLENRQGCRGCEARFLINVL